ncbi:MAG: PD40 domain-containing protein [Acidobacteria bacterium]|nr:PD40 domain-containing protein [Acidobacteriota bacterium]
MTFPSEHSARRDEKTGAVVHQITAHPSINHPSYFLHSSFTPDQKAILFTSYRSGQAQLFEAGYPDGPIRQLTAGAAIHAFSPVIAPDGETVYLVRGGGLWATGRSTLAERQVIEFTGAQLGECSLDVSGEWITAACKQGGQSGIAVGRTDGTRWRVIEFPRTVIHPQFSPVEPEWIEFAADPAPRMHRVRRDGTSMECLYEHGNDEFVVHETFLGATGDLVFTVWPRAVRRMSWRTRRIETIAEFNAWHITPNRAGTAIVCDTNHPDIGLQLIDVASGRRRTICYPESSNQGTQWTKSRYALAEDWAAAVAEKQKALSWMEMATDSVYGPQWTHPHPSFSPDEKLVAFASDRTGHTQVYVVELT